MYFKSIKTNQFRNLKNQKVELSSGTNILVGKNGQGKTNFLEALSFLCSGKSFRPHQSEHFVSWNAVEKTVYLCAEIKKENAIDLIEFQYKEKGQISKNQKKTSWTKITQEMPHVLFSPESLNSIKSGPGERRQLIDDCLCLLYPHASVVLKNYQKALRSRNRILSDYKKEKIHQKQALDLLESINRPFLEAAMELLEYRLKVIEEIVPLFQKVAREILGQENVEIRVDYVASKEVINTKSREQIQDLLKKRIEELSKAELAYGNSLVGPHKHDIYFLYQGYDSRYYCSQGQQRALILSFKMAKIMYYRQANGHWPFLFLDDVLSELDADKRNHLIGFLRRSEGQTFITTTDLSFSQDLSDVGSKIWNVEQGLISPNR